MLKNFGLTRYGRIVFYDYDELCELTSQDETDSVRKKCFDKYPALRQEYELHRKNAKSAGIGGMNCERSWAGRPSRR